MCPHCALHAAPGCCYTNHTVHPLPIPCPFRAHARANAAAGEGEVLGVEMTTLREENVDLRKQLVERHVPQKLSASDLVMFKNEKNKWVRAASILLAWFRRCLVNSMGACCHHLLTWFRRCLVNSMGACCQHLLTWFRRCLVNSKGYECVAVSRHTYAAVCEVYVKKSTQHLYPS